MPNSTPTSPGLNNRLLRLAKAEAVRRRLARAHQTPQTDLSGYQRHPVAFARDILGVDPWERQEEIMRSVAAHPRTTVRSCHNSGKSFLAGCLTHWWLRSYSPSLVITTAPTARQVKEVLWNEIRARHRQASLPGALGMMQLELSVNQRAVGLSTNDPVRFQGWHCLSEEHQILTRRGWLGIDDITEADEVLSVPVAGETAEWMPVTAVHRYPFDGELNVYDGAQVSFAVTDEHRFVCHGQENRPRWELRPLSEHRACEYVRRVTDWEGEAFSVPTPFARYGWDPEQFAEFLGFWIGDGGLRMHGKTGRFYEVLLYQVRPDGGYTRGLLPGVRVQTGRDHVVFCNRPCAEWLAENVGRYGAQRRIPRLLLDGPKSVLEAFAEGFWRAEGTIIQGRKRGVYNSNAALMDQVQELLIKLGKPTTLGVNRRAGSKKNAGGRSFSMRRDCLCLTWPENPGDHGLLRKKISRQRYQGRVWCISTPHQTFYTRRNGRVFLSGNSPNILVIVDEASGVDEEIYQAVEGILTGPNAKLLLLGNPNHPAGTFYESFRSPLYRRFHIAASDVPARLLPPGWAAERRLAWGEDSVMYQVRVLGQFPPQGDNALVSLAWAEAAQQRELAEGQPCELGVDVAGYGTDESVIYVRKGDKIVDAVYMRKLEPMALVGRITAVARRWQPTLIKVDEVGMGWGIVGALEAAGLPVLGVNVGERAVIAPDEYDNLRTEIFVELAERLRAGEIQIPAEDQLLVDQLTALTYTYTPKGKRKLVSKEDMRKERGMGLSWSSPDRADALALCFAANLGGFTPVVKAGPPREVDRWSEHSRPQGTDLPW